MKIEHEEILHSTAVPFKAFTFRSHDLSRIIPNHWHQSTEILFVLKGKLKVKLSDRTNIISAHEFIIINPNTVHSTQSITKNYVLCLQIPFSFMSSITNNKFQKEFNFDPNIHQFREITQLHQDVSKLALFTEKEDNSIQNSLSIYIFGLTILKNLLFKLSTKKNKSNEFNIDFSNEFIGLIANHYNESLHLSDIAQYFGYSDSYCSRLIKKNFGYSFSDYLTSVRIEKAIDIALLEHPNLELLAEKVGFKSYRNLYNGFIKNYGCPPLEIIKRFGK